MRFFVSLLATLVATALPLHAAETAWQEIAPAVSIRLIGAGTIDPNGKTLMALEIDMPANTKTYWRVPGETGLPLDLDISASQGISGYEVHWPYPRREQKSGYLDYVYYGRTVLPLEVSVDAQSAVLDVKATLGICSEICIPAQARFTLPIGDGPVDRPSGLRIKQALANVPIAWDDGPEPLGSVWMLNEHRALGIDVVPGVLDEASLIAATIDGEPLFGVPQKSPQDDLVLLPILGKSDNSALEGAEIELIFMTDRGPYEVSRTVEAGEPVETEE